MRGPGLYADAGMDWWLVYVDPNDGFHGIRSSTIIGVSKASGKVMYAGRARDEG